MLPMSCLKTSLGTKHEAMLSTKLGPVHCLLLVFHHPCFAGIVLLSKAMVHKLLPQVLFLGNVAGEKEQQEGRVTTVFKRTDDKTLSKEVVREET